MLIGFEPKTSGVGSDWFMNHDLCQKYFPADPYRSSSAFWFKVAISLEAEHLQCQVVNTLKPPKNVPSLGERATRAEISESFTFFLEKGSKDKVLRKPRNEIQSVEEKRKEERFSKVKTNLNSWLC